MADFDVIVIGAGPGGYVAAIRAAQNGLKVACVEERTTLGGTCLNVGCIPSKALLHASELFEEVAGGQLAKYGITASATVDHGKLLASKEKAVKGLTDGVAYLFRKNKVEWLRGRASFESNNSVRVDGKVYSARNIVVATGSSVTPLPGAEIDNGKGIVVDSTGALSLAEVPKHLVVIGGGVIGLELGSVWRRLGARVTVLEYLDEILPGMDGEVRKESRKLLEKQGMEIRTGMKVTAVKAQKSGAKLTLEPAGGGKAETLEADVVLVSIGRRPNTEGLAIEKAGLALNKRGQIEVDRFLATSVAGIWAIGDVTPGPMLAHKAEDEGVAVADNIAGLAGYLNHAVIPSVVYTMPEIAGVGLTEEASREQGEIRVGKFPFMANSRAKTNQDTDGFVKVIADAKTDRVLGVWIVNRLAGTLIAEAALAMEMGASSEDIALTCHAHPTHSEALKEAAMAVTGKALHI